MRFSSGAGRVLKPAVFPLAALGGGSLLLNQVGNVADDVSRAVNPPLDKTPVDTNGDGVPETWVLFDRKTGLFNAFGQPPATTQENDRQELGKLTVVVVAAGAVLVVGLLTLGGRS